MWIQQMFVALLCALAATQQIAAVVNNAQPAVVTEGETKITSENSESSSSTSTNVLVDSLAASSDNTEANRREAPLGETYGAPIPHEVYGPPPDTYVPSAPSNIGLPLPVYGLPDGPKSNIIYPAPPADIPPQIPSFGLPKDIHFGPPKEIYGPPKELFTKYGPPPPAPFPKLPKPFNGPPFHKIKPIYGPPRLQYGPPHHKQPHFKLPKPIYGPPFKHHGPPKPHYGPPPKPHYGPPLKLHGPPQPPPFFGPPKEIYGPPFKDGFGFPPKEHQVYGPPKPIYGPPLKLHTPPQPQYGLPEAIPHGPPHPGVPAPPTPPDIKYDGWQPIPGLISRPPTDNHIHVETHTDFVPPPQVQGGHGVQSLSLGSSYGSSAGISDSYGAPLNTVTGSGGIVSTSGDAHIQSQDDQNAISLGLSAAGIGSGHDGQLSVVKSIGYEIFPHGGAGGSSASFGGNSGSTNFVGGSSSYNSASNFEGSSGSFGGGSTNFNVANYDSANSFNGASFAGNSNFGGGSSFSSGDTYGAPPLNSYSPNGPYAASHSYKHNGASSFSNSFGFNKGSVSLSSSGIGLIPPSGQYGVPPSGQYGTPLLSGGGHHHHHHHHQQHHGNSLDLSPPKHPVVFRDPVPHGLIQSIGHQVAQKDAAGIVEHSSSFSGGSSYIPPPVAELPHGEEPRTPTNLYSLPHSHNTVNFQSNSVGSSEFSSSSSYNNFGSSQSFGGAHQLTSYSAPINSYGIPIEGHQGGITVGLDHSLPAATIDLTHFGNPNSFGAVHDCNAHKSQPIPQLTYGVPSVNSYTASLSSLKTNIGGGHFPSLTYGNPDLQAAHTQSNSISNGASVNAIDDSITKEQYGKSLAESFAPGGELVKSQSIDFNNIPVQGSLGSYTLQIQAADGAAGTHPSSVQVPHDQVLNDGLLQSILAAIEQPQQKDAQILGQPILTLQSDQSQLISQIRDDFELPSAEAPHQFSKQPDDEAQQSIKNPVVISPPTTETSVDPNKETQTQTEKTPETDASLQLIDNNEIALYFHNKPQEPAKDQQNAEPETKNGQQYGSYVSFQTPTSSYVYGDLKPEPTPEQ